MGELWNVIESSEKVDERGWKGQFGVYLIGSTKGKKGVVLYGFLKDLIIGK